jgi:hypothetical protein
VRRFDTCFRNIRVFSGVAVDFPNVNSNQTVSASITTSATFPLGTAILTWGFESDATDLQDLQISIVFTNANTLRFVLSNLTGGAIDPASHNMFFVTGEINTDLSETI